MVQYHFMMGTAAAGASCPAAGPRSGSRHRNWLSCPETWEQMNILFGGFHQNLNSTLTLTRMKNVKTSINSIDSYKVGSAKEYYHLQTQTHT